MARSLLFALPLLAVIALAGCVPPPAPEQAPAPPPMPPPPPAAEAPSPTAPATASSDQDFINQAAGINAAEIGMGRLAGGKAASSDVRSFAEHMTVDHSHADRELAALAKRLRLQVAPPPDQPPPELLISSGPDFDKAYIGLAIKAHRNAIALFESEANNGQDLRLKHFANSILPELQHHLHEAEMLGQRIGAGV